MPSIKYDDNGNMIEGTTDEEAEAPTAAAADGPKDGSKKKKTAAAGKKRKRKAAGLALDADSDASSGDEGAADGTGAAQLFAEYDAQGGDIKIGAEETAVVVRKAQQRGKRPAAEEAKWEKKAQRKKRKQMTLLSNKPETETANADQVNDMYGVSKGRF